MTAARTIVPLFLAAMATAPSTARATPRPRFEPTDLGMQSPGALQIDAQVGASRGPSGTRVAVPDLELGLGLTPNVELDLDAAFGVTFSDGHRDPESDPLWPSLKFGLFDVASPSTKFAGGAQLGPRLPSTTKMLGPGYEVLVLLGLQRGGVQLALNGGGIVDPGQDGARTRPYGALVGVDAAVTLDAAARWTALSELAAARYGAVYENELTGTLGIAYAATPTLTFSAIALASPSSSQQRYGVLFGMTPTFRVW